MGNRSANAEVENGLIRSNFSLGKWAVRLKCDGVRECALGSVRFPTVPL